MHLGFVPVPELKIAIDPETGKLILPEINGNFFQKTSYFLLFFNSYIVFYLYKMYIHNYYP